MILNKTTRYALTILGFMATRNEEMYSAEFLYEQLHIPRRYLRRLLTELSVHGFIRSTKGRNGGFVFAIPPAEISFLSIIDALEEPGAMDTCLLGFSCCIVDKPCAMHDKWLEARSKMSDTLTNTTLADLREKYKLDVTDNSQTIIT
jgi:Rrf2 family transcriptional regulator, iron-sulfur cluster assembly transcription factor